MTHVLLRTAARAAALSLAAAAGSAVGAARQRRATNYWRAWAEIAYHLYDPERLATLKRRGPESEGLLRRLAERCAHQAARLAVPRKSPKKK